MADHRFSGGRELNGTSDVVLDVKQSSEAGQ